MAAGRKRGTPLSLSLSHSLTLSLSFSLTLSLFSLFLSRSLPPVLSATDRGENRPKIRGYETRRANTREVRATKKISSIPGFRSRPPGAPRRTCTGRMHRYSRACVTYIFQRQFSRVFGKFLDQSRCSLFPPFHTFATVSSRTFSFLLLLLVLPLLLFFPLSFGLDFYFMNETRSFNGCNNEDT